VVAALAAAELACNALGGASPTPPPIATLTPTALGGVPSPTPPPGDTPAAPPSATAPSTAAPGETSTTTVPPTPTLPGPEPREAIVILEPGGVSSVASPVRVAGLAEPTFEQNLVIQITDGDGAVIATEPTTIQAEAGTGGPYAVEVAFTVAADQPGRISVFHASPRDGGLVHLASVEVTLLAGGAAAVTPGGPQPEFHQILAPAPLAEVSGGSLHVSGFSAYVFEGTLNLALCGEGGSGAPDPICGTADNVLATGFTTLQAPDIGQPGPYEADLAYTITGPVQARLAVFSYSARDGGLVHLTSVPVNLRP
jgi:hypothetical protein